MKLRNPFLCALAALVLLVAALLSPVSGVYVSQAQRLAPEVPAAYVDLYADLSSRLDTFMPTLDALWDGTPGGTVFGAELLPANGNRGAALLDEGTLDFVCLYLDRLHEMGVGGVSLSIAFPILTADYPRSDEFLAFYQSVMGEIRSRGMKALIESGPAFPDPQYSRVIFDYSTYTLDSYFAARREQLWRIAIELQPDYLSLSSEVATESMLVGQSFGPEEYIPFLQTTLAGLDHSGRLMVGVGSGLWEAEAQAYFSYALAESQVDFIDVHIYPLAAGRHDFLQDLLDLGATAAEAGKRVIIGEAWLYKSFSTASAMAEGYQAAFVRDLYSFWAPLDIRFIEAIVGIAHLRNFEYVSFFWANYFFSYLTHEPALETLSPVELYAMANRQSARSVLHGLFSPTGEAYAALLRP